MTNGSNPLHFYESNIKELNSALTKLRANQSQTSWMRLGSFVLLIAGLGYTWPMGIWQIGIAIIVFLSIFLFLVSLSLRTEEKIKNIENLLKVNEEERNSLLGKYDTKYDGAVFTGRFHFSDTDLDIFGKASLFQYVNRATSDQGRENMAKYLTTVTDKQTVLQKQAAVRELQKMTAWRQQLQALGMRDPITKNSEEVIAKWIHEPITSFITPVWQIIRYAIPAIALGSLICYAAGIIPGPIFYGLLFILFVFALSISKKVTRQYSRLSKVIAELETFAPVLRMLEDTAFASPFIYEKQKLVRGNGTASLKIAELKKILDRLDYRLNPLVHLPLNILLLWDLQQALALQQWKRSQTEQLAHWYEAMAEMEALSSLATLTFNHPRWCFPVISNHWFEMECSQIGHPLISPSRLVTNEFAVKGSPQIILVTGSNMAGKSTFLRAIGTNMLLAMAGGPVCASYMKIPITKVMSSMRITDNLEEETSTFYAELKKLKAILEAVQNKEKVFLLLDEMLRGTNSLDRHTGSAALLVQLIQQDAVGIIASHDIPLSSMEKEYPEDIKNYHFDSSIVNEEIIFDYKLKNGICQSTNATLLMKKIGIRFKT